MRILDQAVEAVQAQAAKGRVNGAQLALTLEAIAACGEQALRIWQGYLDNPGAPGDKYSIVSWIGAERAKQLHELSLMGHALVSTVCAAAGDQARFLVLEESPIVLAYHGLKEGETGPQAAQAAVALQREYIEQARAFAGQMRNIKSVATPAKAVKKPGGKKAAPQATQKKATPKKKTATKKPAAKKAPKKPAKKK